VAQPKRSRDAAGRYAQHSGIRTNINLKGDPVAEVIAAENVIVHDDNLEIDRIVIAGQPVPPDLVDAYHEKVGHKAEEPVADAHSDDSSSSNYADQTVEDLRAEADRRELEVEGTGKDGNVVKKDLVAALEASDADAAAEVE
jgi:hypothetical protein